MARYAAIPTISVLLVLALAPWLLSTCAPGPYVPEELRQERVHYQETADAIRTLTIVAQRQADSALTVNVLGTVAPTSPNRAATPSASATNLPTATATIGSEITIRVITPGLTPKPSAATPSVQKQQTRSPTATVQTPPTRPPTPTALATAVTSVPLPTQRLQTVVDDITEEMLTAQARKELANNSISDVSISFRDNGIWGVGYVTIFPILRRQIQGKGTLLVKNASLVTNITSITLDGTDVTEQYRTALEDRVNWGLYQLLPQRFVQSFDFRNGTLRVTSGVRSQ